MSIVEPVSVNDPTFHRLADDELVYEVRFNTLLHAWASASGRTSRGEAVMLHVEQEFQILKPINFYEVHWESCIHTKAGMIMYVVSDCRRVRIGIPNTTSLVADT